MNGIFEAALYTHDEYLEPIEADWRGHIGVKDKAPYTQQYINGAVDEFKLFYRLLSSAGKKLFSSRLRIISKRRD